MEHILSRPSVRLAALLIAAITTRHLFENGFHFPTFLLLGHIVLALACKALVRTRHVTEQQQESSHNSLTTYLWLATYTASIIGALISGYQTLLHVKNTTLWMMIFSLHWDALLPENIRSLLEKSLPGWLFAALRFSTFAMCIGLLYWQDCTMTSKYEYREVGAMVCIKIARRSFQEGRAVSLGEWDTHAIALRVSLVPIMAMMIPKDWSNGGDFALYGRLGLLLLNLPAGTTVLYGGVVYDEADIGECDTDARARSSLKLTRPCIAIFMAALVELDNVLLQLRPTTTTVGQWIAFAVALLSTTDSERVVVQWEEAKMPWGRSPRLIGIGHLEFSGETS